MVLVYIGVPWYMVASDFFGMIGARRKARGKIVAFVWITCMDG